MVGYDDGDSQYSLCIITLTSSLPSGSEWGGQDLENATGRKVTRSYAANLKKGRIDKSGLTKLEAISGAMDFPPALWFGNG